MKKAVKISWTFFGIYQVKNAGFIAIFAENFDDISGF